MFRVFKKGVPMQERLFVDAYVIEIKMLLSTVHLYQELFAHER